MVGYALGRSGPRRSAPYDAGEAWARPHEVDNEDYSLGFRGHQSAWAPCQTSAQRNQMPGPIQNFDGIANLCGCYPPDTEGDVGPNHYMQWVNLHYAIYSKTGTRRSCLRLRATRCSPGGLAELRPHNNGDPIVLYDQYAGRWLAIAVRLRERERAVLRVHRGLDHE